MSYIVYECRSHIHISSAGEKITLCGLFNEDLKAKETSPEDEIVYSSLRAKDLNNKEKTICGLCLYKYKREIRKENAL